jgi:predicted DsbA family dithiol-disulfide isomerase
MRVEIWSDIVCPWCGIGSHVLDKALAEFGHEREVELVRRSFLLDESFPVGLTKPVMEVLCSWKGITETQARQLTSPIESLAEREGLKPYRVLDNLAGNTLLAHSLAAWVRKSGTARTSGTRSTESIGPRVVRSSMSIHSSRLQRSWDSMQMRRVSR